jgi:CHASE2 domain-containing sensor protein
MNRIDCPIAGTRRLSAAVHSLLSCALPGESVTVIGKAKEWLLLLCVSVTIVLCTGEFHTWVFVMAGEM